MKQSKFRYDLLIIGFLLVQLNCSKKSFELTDEEDHSVMKVEGKDYFLPHIDLSHWKVTLPIGDPIEVSPPEIVNYASNPVVKPFMFNDSTDGSLVFYAYPQSSTANSSYSRSELREQMVPGDNSVNWTFAQGGKMKGTLAMKEVTKDKDGKYHKVIIMQIHGRLTNNQRDLIGQKDNNGPPVLKVYWENGKIKVARKVLKNINATDLEILETDSWKDESQFFENPVDFRKFTLEVNVTQTKLQVILNNNEWITFEDKHVLKWGVFENYFKAGNYFQSKDERSFAKVKYYKLEVSH